MNWSEATKQLKDAANIINIDSFQLLLDSSGNVIKTTDYLGLCLSSDTVGMQLISKLTEGVFDQQRRKSRSCSLQPPVPCGLYSSQCDLLKDIYIQHHFLSHLSRTSMLFLFWFLLILCLSHLLFLSLFLPKLVGGGHPAVPILHYIIFGQNETRTARSCGATMVQRDSLGSQDEDLIDLGKIFPWRERDIVLSYDTNLLVCKSAEKLFHGEFLSHMITLWFHSYVAWKPFQVENTTGVIANPCYTYIYMQYMAQGNFKKYCTSHNVRENLLEIVMFLVMLERFMFFFFVFPHFQHSEKCAVKILTEILCTGLTCMLCMWTICLLWTQEYMFGSN